MFSFKYLIDAPIIDISQWPQLKGNANGPSLIKVPPWVANPLARYYLYFAHHEGTSIRLAFADELTGPWKLSNRPALDLSNSLFPTIPPDKQQLAEEALNYIRDGSDGLYPHIASPDAVIDETNQKIRLYYHGRLSNGIQRTRIALSNDGLNFEARDEILGMPYFRVFKTGNYHYALAWPGCLYRSSNGLNNFEAGPQITQEPIRHCALYDHEGSWYVFWTRAGDAPESILCSALLNKGKWHDWRLGPATKIHCPEKSWEGADYPLQPSKLGTSMVPVNQLQDPYIYEEDGRIYLLYSVRGEQGIAIGELIPAACD